MPKLKDCPPKYCKMNGQAVVYYQGRPHYLGRHGTPESKTAYARFIAGIQANPTVPQSKAEKHVRTTSITAPSRTYRHPQRIVVAAKITTRTSKMNVTQSYARRSGIVWRPELRAFYVRELADDVMGAKTLSDVAMGRDSARLGTGLGAQLSDRLSVRVDYDYEVYRYAKTNEFGATVGVSW